MAHPVCEARPPIAPCSACAAPSAEPFVEQLGLGLLAAFEKLGRLPFDAMLLRERELTHDLHPAAHVQQRAVEAALVVLEALPAAAPPFRPAEWLSGHPRRRAVPRLSSTHRPARFPVHFPVDPHRGAG